MTKHNGRPSGIILATTEDSDWTWDILDTVMPCQVVYCGEPFNLRKTHLEAWRSYGPKYLKTHYPTPAHAWRLADRLNQLFDCEDFSVVQVSPGRAIPKPA